MADLAPCLQPPRLVAALILAAAVACGCASTPAPSTPASRAGDPVNPELLQYRSVDRERERPAVRGGPVTPESVSGNSIGGSRPK